MGAAPVLAPPRTRDGVRGEDRVVGVQGFRVRAFRERRVHGAPRGACDGRGAARPQARLRAQVVGHGERADGDGRRSGLRVGRDGRDGMLCGGDGDDGSTGRGDL